VRPTNVRDEFAELYVAGLFADRKWTVYFPRRDKGFDFIVTKQQGNEILVRPVQVKGVYPEEFKKGGRSFGRTMKLTAIHPQMVLAMPFFEYSIDKSPSPKFVGFFPIKPSKKEEGKHQIHPALLNDGVISIRRDYQIYFGEGGIGKIEKGNWGAKSKTAR